jgi:hypothetical protein
VLCRSERLLTTVGKSLLISCRSLEFDAVAFWISQVNGRTLALGAMTWKKRESFFRKCYQTIRQRMRLLDEYPRTGKLVGEEAE